MNVIIFSRGSADGICATALYVRAILKAQNLKKNMDTADAETDIRKSQYQPSFKIVFCDNFELAHLFANYTQTQTQTQTQTPTQTQTQTPKLVSDQDVLVFIDLSVSQIIEELILLPCRVRIFIDKLGIDLLELKTKLKSHRQFQIHINPDVSTSRVVYEFVRNKEPLILTDFDLYLVTIGELSDQIVSFKQFPQYQTEVKNLTASLTLKPFDNEFRLCVAQQLIEGVRIKDIAEVRTRAITSKLVSEYMLNQAQFHKIHDDQRFVVFEYNETDSILFQGEYFEYQGRFAYLTQQLAIIHEKICFVLVHKLPIHTPTPTPTHTTTPTTPTQPQCYVVIRKHNRVPDDLLDIATRLVNFIGNGTFDGHPNAVSINFNLNLTTSQLITAITTII